MTRENRMSFTNASGTNKTKAAIIAAAAVQSQETVYKIGEDVYQRVTLDGGDFEENVRLVLVAGQKVTASQLDALFQAATVDSVTPNTGLAAGGLPVTIKGTNFGGVTGVTFGGTAATSVVVVSETTITCVTPAKTAGAYTVAVADDSGPASKTNAFTYS
jgi:hypothetical protein